MEIFQSYDHKRTATFFMVHSVYSGLQVWPEEEVGGSRRQNWMKTSGL